jgi:hypothetical protein
MLCLGGHSPSCSSSWCRKCHCHRNSSSNSGSKAGWGPAVTRNAAWQTWPGHGRHSSSSRSFSHSGLGHSCSSYNSSGSSSRCRSSMVLQEAATCLHARGLCMTPGVSGCWAPGVGWGAGGGGGKAGVRCLTVQNLAAGVMCADVAAVLWPNMTHSMCRNCSCC